MYNNFFLQFAGGKGGHHLVGRLTRGSMTEFQVLSKFMKYKICLVNVQNYAFFMENILLKNVWVSQH